MRKILIVMLIMTMLLTVQGVPVFADNTDASYTLTKEDEKRIMDYKTADGPFGVTNDKIKELVDNYSLYVDVAKDFMELRENCNYKEIATKVGKKKYLTGFDKYLPDDNLKKALENEQISYITRNKLIKKSTFLTNDDCIFADGAGVSTVRGVLSFKILEMVGDSLESFKNVKKGIEYKADIEVYLSGHPNYTDPAQFEVNGYRYLSQPTVATPSTPTYSASPTSSMVLVNGKTVSFEAYNINGSNYFKLRDLAMAVSGTEKQFEVGWNGEKNAINLTKNKAYIPTGGELTVSADPVVKEAKPTTSKIYLNGQEVSFTAYNINGNNYFKLRDVGKAIDFGVTWDGKTNTIGIDTTAVYTE
jgi:hypothetical protein